MDVFQNYIKVIYRLPVVSAKTADIPPFLVTDRSKTKFCRFAALHRQYGFSASSPYSRDGVIGIL